MSGCTAPGGVWVFSPGGDLLGSSAFPRMAANFAWGGADFRTLFSARDTFSLCDSDPRRAAR